MNQIDVKLRAEIVAKAVDDIIVYLEQTSALRLPETHKKNAYMKACWLIARYQQYLRLGQHPIIRVQKERQNPGAWERVKENLGFLTENLDVLRTLN